MPASTPREAAMMRCPGCDRDGLCHITLRRHGSPHTAGLRGVAGSSKPSSSDRAGLGAHEKVPADIPFYARVGIRGLDCPPCGPAWVRGPALIRLVPGSCTPNSSGANMRCVVASLSHVPPMAQAGTVDGRARAAAPVRHRLPVLRRALRRGERRRAPPPPRRAGVVARPALVVLAGRAHHERLANHVDHILPVSRGFGPRFGGVRNRKFR
jgi:hypothetical protein